MCGINGIVSFKNQVSVQAVQKMNQALAHRGPDNDGVFYNNSVALGHRRLSILDLSANANQPFYSSDKRFVIVYNGELYNYKEVKSTLTEFNFYTQSDTEVVLNAYIKYGANALQHFNGMYAFAIWDTLKEELFIARDRLGVKPLYYALVNHYFIFSSELRAILASGLVNAHIDIRALNQYIGYQTVYAPNTIINDIKVLMPGNYLLLNKNQLVFNTYWNINTISATNTTISYSEACNQIKELFFSSVKQRLISDVPFGAFLSGGIDSTAVVAVMAKLSNQPVNTFSIVFNEKDFSEETYSRLVAEKYQTNHCQINLSVNDFKNLLPEALKALDHPSGDGPNTYVVSKYTKQAGITMALSGIGGDEWFAGYPVFKRLRLLHKYKHLYNNIPLVVKTIIGKTYALIKPGIASYKLKQLLHASTFNFTYHYQLNRQIFSISEIKNLIKNEYHQWYEINLEEFFSDHNFISSISKAEYYTYLNNVLLRDTDQMSMAHALEVREPFMDYRLIEFLLQLPEPFKTHRQPKQLLIDALHPLIPEQVYNRPKMGFTFPWKHWMQNDLKTFCEERIYNLSKRTYFKNEAIIHLWSRFLNNDPLISWSRVWLLVVLEEWLSNNKVN